MEIINNTVYFESDAEFEDFCIAPHIIVKEGDTSFSGDYSDLYKQYLAEGKTFVIMDEDSVIERRNCASKRVPVIINGRSTGRTALVQLRVANLEPWFYDMTLPEDFSPEERNAISKLINDNAQVTYQQIAGVLNISEEEALNILKWWEKEGIVKQKN